jgi:hypothetical protein
VLYVVVVVLLVVGGLSALASRHTLREMGEYRERFKRDAPNTQGWADFPASDRQIAQRQIKRGRAVTNREIAAAMLRQYDAVGTTPDFTRRSGLVADLGLTIICVLLVLGGMWKFAVAAFVALLVMLVLTGWKWHLRRAIQRSVVATRRTHYTE